MYAMTAAHKTMELPSYAKVTNLKNGKSVIVRVNDRGPFVDNRIIDLSYAAASKLGYVKNGTAPVKVERIRMADIKNGRIPATSGGLIKLIDNSKVSDNSADIAAIASVIGVAANVAKTIKQNQNPPQQPQNTQNTQNTQKSIQPNTIVVESSPTTSFRLDDVPDDLAGAVNLTEAAKNEMVSTEVDLINTDAASSSSVSQWCIQIGAFGSEANARNYAQTVQTQLNLPAVVYPDGCLYRVTVGQYASKEEAVQQASVLGNKLGKKLVPVQIP